jgi:LPXTG-motif cell wall-anchored protein
LVSSSESTLSSTKKSNETLPQTGENNNNEFAYLGLAALLGAIGLAKGKKKKKISF